MNIMNSSKVFKTKTSVTCVGAKSVMMSVVKFDIAISVKYVGGCRKHFFIVHSYGQFNHKFI